jgi:hypothetical protein
MCQMKLTLTLVVALCMATALHAQSPALTNSALQTKVNALELEIARLHGQLLLAEVCPAVPTPTPQTGVEQPDTAASTPLTTLSEAAAKASKVRRVQAQTGLAEAAAEAARTPHEWPLSPNTGPKTYTNTDLPNSGAPSVGRTASTDATTSPPPVARSGPTDAQLASVEESKMRGQLYDAQRNYHMYERT